MDSSLAERELGVRTRPLEATLADHIRGLLQRGPIAFTSPASSPLRPESLATRAREHEGTLASMGRTGCLVLALGGAAGLAAAAVGIALVLARDPEPATVEDALAAFRAELGGRAPLDAPLPEGVYVYATDGYEETDALTGVTNRYPSRSSITVLRDPCGFRMRWEVTEGRSTTWTVCTDADGWELARQDERHTFFGQTERTTYRCTAAPFRLPGDEPGASAPVRCATRAAEEQGRIVVVSRELVAVGAMEVDTVHLRRSTTLTGAIRGRTRHDVWLDRETALPVQLRLWTSTANDSPIGEVRYEEEVELRLEALEPRR